MDGFQLSLKIYICKKKKHLKKASVWINQQNESDYELQDDASPLRSPSHEQSYERMKDFCLMREP